MELAYITTPSSVFCPEIIGSNNGYILIFLLQAILDTEIDDLIISAINQKAYFIDFKISILSFVGSKDNL
jgi:hypothetical protein